MKLQKLPVLVAVLGTVGLRLPGETIVQTADRKKDTATHLILFEETRPLRAEFFKSRMGPSTNRRPYSPKSEALGFALTNDFSNAKLQLQMENGNTGMAKSVLPLDPNSREGKKIRGLTAYEEGDY